MSTTTFSIIIPAYRQAQTIAADLKRIHSVAEKLRYSTEIICVVDGLAGDQDKTLLMAQKAAKSLPNVRILFYTPNRGKGNAIQYGMSRAQGEIIGFIDAGMDINPNGLSMLLEHMEWYQADAVVGSKRHPASRLVYPWQRRILSLVYQTLVWLLFGLKVRDTQVGLKIFRRPLIDKVLPLLLVKRYAFDIEMLAVANHLGFSRIYEAPVDLKLDFGGTSNLTSRKFIRTVGNMLWDTLAVFYRLRILKYYDK